MNKSVIGVIPARYASTRLPGKPLATILGKPMVEWVYRSAKKALSRVIVATDDRRVAEAVRRFGGEAMLTPASCLSGTDRVACVARKIRASYYVNVQGDEPLMHPDTIRAAVKLAVKNKAIATASTRLLAKDRANPSAVKVVTDYSRKALYFSRATIPARAHGVSRWPKSEKHLGLYVYPKALLLRFVKHRPTALEKTEKLEQLRALFYGLPIYVAMTPHDSTGVDTPADLRSIVRTMRSRQHTNARRK